MNRITITIGQPASAKSWHEGKQIDLRRSNLLKRHCFQKYFVGRMWQVTCGKCTKNVTPVIFAVSYVYLVVSRKITSHDDIVTLH